MLVRISDSWFGFPNPEGEVYIGRTLRGIEVFGLAIWELRVKKSKCQEDLRLARDNLLNASSLQLVGQKKGPRIIVYTQT